MRISDWSSDVCSSDLSMGARMVGDLTENAGRGREAVWQGTGGGRRAGASDGPSVPSDGGAPAWARRLRAEQRQRARIHSTAQTIREGDKPGTGASPALSGRRPDERRMGKECGLQVERQGEE